MCSRFIFEHSSVYFITHSLYQAAHNRIYCGPGIDCASANPKETQEHVYKALIPCSTHSWSASDVFEH